MTIVRCDRCGLDTNVGVQVCSYQLLESRDWSNLQANAVGRTRKERDLCLNCFELVAKVFMEVAAATKGLQG